MFLHLSSCSFTARRLRIHVIYLNGPCFAGSFQDRSRSVWSCRSGCRSPRHFLHLDPIRRTSRFFCPAPQRATIVPRRCFRSPGDHRCSNASTLQFLPIFFPSYVRHRIDAGLLRRRISSDEESNGPATAKGTPCLDAGHLHSLSAETNSSN